jgi:hypothetical protein
MPSDFDGPCEIRRAGVTADGRAQIDLQAADKSWDWRWCLSDPARTREVLAVALTAIATSKHVYCSMAEPVAATPTIKNFGMAA